VLTLHRLFAFSLLAGWGSALAAPREPLTIAEAVRKATEDYPASRVSQEQFAAASRGINLARASYLPRVDLLAQFNRATRNNVFGLLLPQPIIPSISGPVLGTDDSTSVWGSAVGVLVSWEPFDFGARGANVEAAESGRDRAAGSLGRTRLDLARAAADLFLTVLAAGETVRGSQASVERARTLERVVDALVAAELRPGVDQARTRAERALAETQLILAEQALEATRISLAQLLGIPRAELTLEPGILNGRPGAIPPLAGDPSQHPRAREQEAVVAEIRAREKALARSYFPRFNLMASSYARGTGAHVDGSTADGLTGLWPEVSNWAVGLNISLPALEIVPLHIRRDIESHRERAEAARYEQTLRELKSEMEKAEVGLQAARRIAENTPVQLEAARGAEQQANARYRAGLGTIVEVADSERLLTQAEIDDALAGLNVWRALLEVAAADGDLDPFLREAATAGQD